MVDVRFKFTGEILQRTDKAILCSSLSFKEKENWFPISLIKITQNNDKKQYYFDIPLWLAKKRNVIMSNVDVNDLVEHKKNNKEFYKTNYNEFKNNLKKELDGHQLNWSIIGFDNFYGKNKSSEPTSPLNECYSS